MASSRSEHLWPRPGSYRPNERDLAQMRDLEWCYGNADIMAHYAGQIVAVHNQALWGAGADYVEALNAARAKAGCPSPDDLSFITIPWTLDFIDDGPEQFEILG